MSANNNKTILITGANGFVAMNVVQKFLEAGYKVKATVRSDAKFQDIVDIFPAHASQLSYAIVKDIAADGAFDEAVKGVDGVIHTASPYIVSGITDNEKDLLIPALKGTSEILSAVKKYAPQVKRVVVTSSFAAIVDVLTGKRPGYVYTEADWNPATYNEAKTSSIGPFVYCASKKFAEKAAWDFVENDKPNFSVATVNPPMVYGPAIQNITSLKNLNTSTADIYRLFNGSTPTVPVNGMWAWVDVRDLAVAHLRAYEHPTGGRYAITAGYYSYKQVADILSTVPEVEKSKVSVNDESTEWPESVYHVDNSKSVKELGMEYTSLEKSITDMARQMIAIEKKLGQQ